MSVGDITVQICNFFLTPSSSCWGRTPGWYCLVVSNHAGPSPKTDGIELAVGAIKRTDGRPDEQPASPVMKSVKGKHFFPSSFQPQDITLWVSSKCNLPLPTTHNGRNYGFVQGSSPSFSLISGGNFGGVVRKQHPHHHWQQQRNHNNNNNNKEKGRKRKNHKHKA